MTQKEILAVIREAEKLMGELLDQIYWQGPPAALDTKIRMETSRDNLEMARKELTDGK